MFTTRNALIVSSYLHGDMSSADPNHTQGLDIIIVARGYSTPLLTATATDPNGTKNYVPADKTILVAVKLRHYKSSSFVEN